MKRLYEFKMKKGILHRLVPALAIPTTKYSLKDLLIIVVIIIASIFLLFYKLQKLVLASIDTSSFLWIQFRLQ